MTIIDVVREREQLLARCEAQRDYFAGLAEHYARPLKVADGALAGVRYLRDHPLVLGIVAAALAASRGRGAVKWAQRGWLVWRAYSALRK